MKKLLIIAAAMFLAACASPRNATVEDGKVTNITSAEAVTLMKGEQRRTKVQDVQTNAKPIFKMVGHPGKPITIDAASFEVNVPLDIAVLMAEQPDAVSENVQMFREVRGFAKETIVPLGLGAMLLEDRKNASSNALEASRIQAETDQQRTQATADLTTQAIDAASKPPVILQVPLGSSILPAE